MITSGDRLQWLLDIVEQCLDEPELRGEALAKRAHLSRFHFDRLVAAALGESPGALRRRLLLERSAHRLAASDARVIDVALDAGFGSPEAFTRAFSRAYGASPSAYRHQAATSYDLGDPGAVHFHPPGGLRLPSIARSGTMDVLTGMVDHHLWLVGEIVDRTGRVDAETLDRPIDLSVESIDERPTSLRIQTDKLVYQLEMWVTAVEGGTAMPPRGDTTSAGLRRRLDEVAPRFRELVVAPVREGRGDETFVDAVCDPPEIFSYGGIVAHVLTFSAVRRTMAIGALETAGIDDLGSGDPMRHVGGSGTDASDICRRPPA
ncbi:MAG TPA: AraC family transcriptional regulator [Gaiellales bacterium]|nr:AraC family transcriptional regulator [Gaiellales bacterium]